MKHNDPISDEQLNALLDNELDTAERERLLQLIHTDPASTQRYCELRQVKELVTLAYQEIPEAHRQPPLHTLSTRRFGLMFAGMAAAVLVSVTSTVGIMNAQHTPTSPPIQSLAQIDPAHPPSNKILLHVSSLDAPRVNAALDTAEKLILASRADASGMHVEIVANAEGLGVLRQGSPYTDRIRTLASQYGNLQFSACANTKHLAYLQEGKDISLLPEAHEVPNALDQIVKRLADGWLYVRA